MALILLLAATLSAQPAKLVLGKDGGADLSLDAPAKAVVTFSATAGSVGEAVRKGEAWTARFTPPKVHAPTVALVLAQVDQGGDRDLYWLSIPMSGSDTMEIETRPGSQVEADVAGERIGPVTADKSGTAKLHMVVPPGVEKATLRITDKLGNTNEKRLDLEPPPFTRVRIAAREEAVQADGSLEVEIFAVKADGSPDDEAKPEISADAGDVRVKRRIDHGVYLAEYTPPEGKSAGTAKLSVKGAGSLEVPVRPRAPGKLWPTALSRPWSISAGAMGAVGATFDGGTDAGFLLEGALRLKNYPLEALLDIGGSWFSEVTQGAGPGTTKASTSAWLVQAGVRASLMLAPGFDGHLSLLAGMIDQKVNVHSITRPAGIDDSVWIPRIAFAVGANAHVGMGRLLMQVQIDSSASNQAGLQGSLGGAQLQIGYLVPLR